MTIERTFSMIKPDATDRNLVGSISAMIEESGLRIIASKRIRMTQEKAAEFMVYTQKDLFFKAYVILCVLAQLLFRY